MTPLSVGDRVRTLVESRHREDPPQGSVGHVSFIDDPEMYEVQFPKGMIGAYWRHELQVVA